MNSIIRFSAPINKLNFGIPEFLTLVDLYMKPAPLVKLYLGNEFWKTYFQELEAGDD